MLAFVWIRLLLGPFIGLISGLIANGAGLDAIMARVVGVTMWKITWWLDSCVRMGITGLLPIVLLPLLGVSSGNDVSQLYFSDGMVLCIGSLLIAHAIETCHIHVWAAQIIQRIAAKRGLATILLTFVMVSGFLSMWISNTATAALMLPIANAFVQSMSKKHPPSEVQNMGTAIDLAIAFSVSVGGMATLIGTGSNIVLLGVMNSIFGENSNEVTFLGWMVMAAPLSIINLLLVWLLLSACYLWHIPERIMDRVYHRTLDSTRDKNDSSTIQHNPLSNLAGDSSPPVHPPLEEDLQFSKPPVDDSPEVPVENPVKLTYRSKVVIVTFLTMAILWMTRDPPGSWGWSAALGVADFVTDGTVAMTACIFLMIIPAEPLTLSECIEAWHIIVSSCFARKKELEKKPSFSLSPLSSPRTMRRYEKAKKDGDGAHAFAGDSLDIHEDEESVVLRSVVVTDQQQSKQDLRTTALFGIEMTELPGQSPNAESSVLEIRLEANPADDQAQEERKTSPVDLSHQADSSSTGIIRRPFNHRSSHDDEEAGSSRSNQSSDKSKHQSQSIYEAVLPWSAVQTLNWDVIFLLGGGFALSEGFENSGLSLWISNLIVNNGPEQLPGFIAIACVLSCIITNFMSNVAAANVLLPSLACVGPHYGDSPLYVLMPVTLSISLALLFPMGTPPNALILTNKRVTTKQLLLMGGLCSLVSLATIIIYCVFIMPIVVPSLRDVSSTVQSVCGDSS